MAEKTYFCSYLKSVITIYSCTISTKSYGRGGKSFCTPTKCSAQEHCSNRYSCKYSDEGNNSFYPSLKLVDL